MDPIEQIINTAKFSAMTEDQKNTLENTLGDDYAEIQHLMSSLNVECEAQLLEALKRKLG